MFLPALLLPVWALCLAVFSPGSFLVVTDSAPREWVTALGFVMMVGAVVGLFFMSSLVDRM